MKLFISYARVDVPLCKQVVERLSDVHEVWYDRRLFAGQDWWKEIESKLRWCEGFVYLLSAESANSDYCLRECELALNYDRHIFPVVIQTRVQIPGSLQHFQYADLSQGMDNFHVLLNAVTVAEGSKNVNPVATLERLDEDEAEDLDPSQHFTPLTAVRDAAESMESGNYDRAVFILQSCLARATDDRERRILEIMLDEAELNLKEQSRLREAAGQYAPIAELVKQTVMKKLGCEAFADFQQRFPDYDPEGLAQRCMEAEAPPPLPSTPPVVEMPLIVSEMPPIISEMPVQYERERISVTWLIPAIVLGLAVIFVILAILSRP